MRQGGLLFHRQYTLEMAEAGQLIRRDLDLSGVKFEFKTAVADQARLERLHGQFAEVVLEVLLVADQAAMAAGVSAKKRARESGARLSRLVRMFSFAVRVPAIVEEARLARVRVEGEKPFVVVDSTFEAALRDVTRRGLPKTFAGLLMREVECAREIGFGDRKSVV